MCSKRNGGLLVPSLTMPWPCWATVRMALRSLLTPGLAPEERTVRLHRAAFLDTSFWNFCSWFLVNCSGQRVLANYRASFILSQFSLAQMDTLQVPHECYRRMSRGTASLFASLQARDSLLSLCTQSIIPLGCEVLPMKASAVTAGGPMLASIPGSPPALYAPNDSAGDVCLYTRELARRALDRGVRCCAFTCFCTPLPCFPPLIWSFVSICPA